MCSIEGCDRPVYTAGLCRTHRSQYMKKHRLGRYAKDCSIEGCHEPIDARGLCSKHYKRWQKSGDPNFCGYLLLAKSHNKEYRIWAMMKQRCNNPKTVEYERYGGRGITVCPEWNTPEGFAAFFSDMGECPEGCSLDRIDIDKGYSPDNCRWADANVQAANKQRRVKRTGVHRLSSITWRAEMTFHGQRHTTTHSTYEGALASRERMERKFLGRVLQFNGDRID